MHEKELKSNTKRIIINPRTLKVERENAKAMIEGFEKGCHHHYLTIYSSHEHSKSIENRLDYFPKLLTNKSRAPRKEYPLSQIGSWLCAETYEVPKKYVAVLDKTFYIRNDIRLWEELCNNGIFDIWQPIAPYNSLQGKKNPRILLLRIFEIDYEFQDDEIDKSKTFYHTIPEKEVNLIKPIITNPTFEDIILILKDSLKKHNCIIEEKPNRYFNTIDLASGY